MSICPQCHGTGNLYRAMADIRKGQWGWFSVEPCGLCLGKGRVTDEACLQYSKWAALPWTKVVG